MSKCKVIGYRVSYWTKGYNKGKINVFLETESGPTMIIENLTPEHGNFILELLCSPGMITCDPESAEGMVYLSRECEPKE